MSAREYCVYNETRENFLMPRVTVLDTRAEPLKAVKVLIEGLEPGSETGLWLNPLKSVPTVPRLSGYDLVYLDPQCRVLQAVALGADDDVPRIDGQTASALVLPIHSFSASLTHLGDKVVLHATDEVASSSPESGEEADPPVPLVRDRVASLARAARPTSPEVETPVLALLPEPEVLPPSRVPKGISLLRSIVHLRIHISISITTAAPAAPLAVLSRAQPVPDALLPAGRSLGSRVASLAEGCAGGMQRAAASTQDILRDRSRACLERCAKWKRRYTRWAEVFVYGAARVNTRAARRAPRRSPRLEEEC